MPYKDQIKQIEYHKQYYILNKNKYKLRQQNTDKEKIRAKYKKHREKYRDKLNENNRKIYQINKRKVIAYYSNNKFVCGCCDENIYEFLTIDHINNDGNIHRKNNNYKTGHHTYLWIIRNNFPNGFQVLCYNCNCARGRSGICPHKNIINKILKK